MKAARENTSRAHDKAKIHYDKKSTVRQLQPGEKALVLLPSDGRKLMTGWRGPFCVLRQLQNNNYELQIGRRRATFHINQLRCFYSDVPVEDEMKQIISWSKSNKLSINLAKCKELVFWRPGENLNSCQVFCQMLYVLLVVNYWVYLLIVT